MTKQKILSRFIFLCIILFSSILLLYYFLIPRKYVLSPVLYKQIFTWSVESDFTIQEAITEVWDDTTGKTAYLDENSNIILHLTPNQERKWKNWAYSWANSFKDEGVTISENYTKVNIVCNKIDIPKKTLYAEYAITECAVMQIIKGLSSEEVHIEVSIIDEKTRTVWKHVNWPDEDYNIDMEEFYSNK